MRARVLRGRSGQAAVELVALLPLVVAGLAAVVQVAIAGHAAWAAAQAASAAARAHAVGLDPVAAARSSLPPHLERRLRIRRENGGTVAVTLAVPVVLPVIRLGDLTARSRFEPQG
jgi:pilus assembly protein CpaE